MWKMPCVLLLAWLSVTPALSAQTLQLPLATDRLSSGNALIELPDGDLVYSGFFQAGLPLGNGNLNVTCLDPTAGVIWSRDYGFEQPGNRSVVRHWPSENALLLGVSLTYGFPYKVLTRLDLAGNVVWTRRFGSLGDFNNINLGLVDVEPLADGTLALAGGAQELANSDGANDLYVARVDAAGNLVWANNYCFSCLGIDAVFGDLLATSDGGFLVTGGVSGTGINASNTFLLLLKIAADGSLEWTRQYQSTAGNIAVTQAGREAVELPSGNFVVAGFFSSFVGSIQDGLLLEVSPAGQFQRAVQVNLASSSHEVRFNNLVALDNNTVVVPGSSEEDVNISVAEVNNFLLQIRLDGGIAWSYNYFTEGLLGYGTPRNDLIRLADGRFGYLANDHEGFDSLNPVLILTDENGRTGCESPLELTTDANVTYVVTDLNPTVQPSTEAVDYGVTTEEYPGFALDLPTLDLGPDTAFCGGFSLPLDAAVGVPATYAWSTGATTASITATEPATYRVTVTATDPCVSLIDSLTVSREDGPARALDTTLCAGEVLQLGGQTFDSSGNYTTFLPGPVCDTALNLTLTVLATQETTVDTLLCPGTELAFGGQTYSNPGTYVRTFVAANGCDSTVTITWDFLESPAVLIEPGVVDCTNATVDLRATGGSDWQWSTGETGNGIAAPAPGSYRLTLTDGNGCLRSDSIELAPIDPERLTITTVQRSDYNGFGVSCPDADDGALGVAVADGQAPYAFQWSTGNQGSAEIYLTAGTYTVTATDNSGCRGVATLEVKAPPAIEFSVDVADGACLREGEGTLTVTPPSGGVAPYVFALAGAAAQTSPVFTGLASGDYRVVVSDVNGCEVTQSATVPTPAERTVDLGADETIRLGESLPLQAVTSLSAIDSIRWTPATDLSCTDCLNPLVTPRATTTYTLSLTDAAGCTLSDAIRVTVIPDRSVYVPTAFSPNGDGANDRFRLFPGAAVERIDGLQIYDRWGALVFTVDPELNSEPAAGWDGRVGDQPAQGGVYVYRARVRFLDGAERELAGEVLLVR